MSFEGKTVFVTGGAGFIGSAVVRHLLDRTSANVVNVDKLTYAANLASIPQGPGHPRYAFARVDICNVAGLRALFDRHQPDFVTNLAAESHVDRSTAPVNSFRPTSSEPSRCRRRRCATGAGSSRVGAPRSACCTSRRTRSTGH